MQIVCVFTNVYIYTVAEYASGLRGVLVTFTCARQYKK